MTPFDLLGPAWVSATDTTSYRLTRQLPVVDLDVAGSARGLVRQGQTFADTVVMTNLGASNAEEATVTIHIGSRLRLLWFTTTRGSCSGTAPLVCTFAHMRSGASATVTLTLRGLTPGRARVRAGAWPRLFDPDLSNNTVKLYTQLI